MLCTLPLDLISFHTWLHLISTIPLLKGKRERVEEKEKETKKKEIIRKCLVEKKALAME